MFRQIYAKHLESFLELEKSVLDMLQDDNALESMLKKIDNVHMPTSLLFSNEPIHCRHTFKRLSLLYYLAVMRVRHAKPVAESCPHDAIVLVPYAASMITPVANVLPKLSISCIARKDEIRFKLAGSYRNWLNSPKTWRNFGVSEGSIVMKVTVGNQIEKEFCIFDSDFLQVFFSHHYAINADHTVRIDSRTSYSKSFASSMVAIMNCGFCSSRIVAEVVEKSSDMNVKDFLQTFQKLLHIPFKPEAIPVYGVYDMRAVQARSAQISTGKWIAYLRECSAEYRNLIDYSKHLKWVSPDLKLLTKQPFRSEATNRTQPRITDFMLKDASPSSKMTTSDAPENDVIILEAESSCSETGVKRKRISEVPDENVVPDFPRHVASKKKRESIRLINFCNCFFCAVQC